MNPQPNSTQLRHALENGQKAVTAKKLEIKAYQQFRYAAAEIASSFNLDSEDSERIREAIENLVTAKRDYGEVELEELELKVKAVEQMLMQSNSRIQVPGLRTPA